jgi:hypothetical protein
LGEGRFFDVELIIGAALFPKIIHL